MIGQHLGTPNPHNSSEKYCGVPPICMAMHPPHVYCCAFLASKPWRKPLKGNPAVQLPFVLQYTSYLFCSTPPICTGNTPRCLISGVPSANQKGGRNEKFMNFTLFCEFGSFSLGKQAQFTSNFGSNLPPRKGHEPTFLWFGLPERLLIIIT